MARRLDPGHRRDPGGRASRSTAPFGKCRCASLIDMARRARRLHRSEPVAEPVHGKPDDRQGLLHVHVCLEEGPEDHLLPAVRARRRRFQDDRSGASRSASRAPKPSPALWKTRRPARRASKQKDVFTMILDPGFNLTLRPMKYPVFYEMYGAIKNTWTVEEVDFSTDVTDLRQKMSPAERHLIKRLVAFFATGDSIVGEQSGAEPLQAHQLARSAHVPVAPALRRGAARAVLPDAARHLHARSDMSGPRRSPPSRTFRSIKQKGGVLLQVDGLHQRDGHARRPKPTRQQLPAESGLLRLLHRRPVLLRRLRLCLLPALAGPAARPGRRHQLGVPRRERAHEFAFEVIAHRPPGGAGPVRRRSEAPRRAT